jgi:hypothetical protein
VGVVRRLAVDDGNHHVAGDRAQRAVADQVVAVQDGRRHAIAGRPPQKGGGGVGDDEPADIDGVFDPVIGRAWESAANAKAHEGEGKGKTDDNGTHETSKACRHGAGGEVENISRTFAPRQGGIAPVHRPPTDKWA